MKTNEQVGIVNEHTPGVGVIRVYIDAVDPYVPPFKVTVLS